MSQLPNEVFVRINYTITETAVFLAPVELQRLKDALAKRPKGEATIQIRCKLQLGTTEITKTIVLDKVQEVTP